jgi:hypothetical protein
MQCIKIPNPMPMAVNIPALLPKAEHCLIMIAVSGPGLVKAIM